MKLINVLKRILLTEIVLYSLHLWAITTDFFASRNKSRLTFLQSDCIEKGDRPFAVSIWPNLAFHNQHAHTMMVYQMLYVIIKLSMTV
jgi:hypothetical protein